jgi:integrase
MEAGRVARLTKRTIDAAEPEATRFIVWDSDLKGFGLRVEPKAVGAKSSTKTFVVRYRVGGGRRGTRRQFKIGSYGKLTPDEARDQAKDILAQVELGQDPQAAKAAARETLTVSELCDLYLDEGVATKKASTLELDRIRIKRHIKPLIGNRRITDIGSAEIERLMNDIAAGRVKTDDSPHSRGGKGAASRTVGLLGGIFKFAMARKLVTENPAKGVSRFKDGKRERFLSPQELGFFGDALAAAEIGADNLPEWQRAARRQHVCIIRLLTLTGARKNEIRRLKWPELDLERGLLQLEDSKTGPKTIRLGAAAQELLSKVHRTKSVYVFPDPRDNALPVRNLDWAWVGVRERADGIARERATEGGKNPDELPSLTNVRIHDLRHSFASTGLAGGSGLHLIGKLLGHANVATTNRYAHLADDPLRDAADRIAASISAAMGGAKGDVRPIKGGAA